MSTAKIIDGDGHVLEDAAEMSAFLPSPYKERGTFGSDRFFPPLDHFHVHTGQGNPAAFGGGKKVGPQEWLAFLEDSGIETTVLYPTSGLSYGRTTDLDWAIATTRAYNDWLYETYLKRSPRFKGMALIPLQDPEAAVLELRRAVSELGMCGVMLPSHGLKSHLGSKEYWPIYREADRLGCAIAIHSGVHSGFGFDDLNVYPVVHGLGHPFGTMTQFGAIVLNGHLDRFPNVRWAFLEGGVAWVLFVLERFDRSYDTHIPYNPRGEPLQLGQGERVSDYVIRQMKAGRIFIGCEGEEEALPYAVKVVGHESFIYSSDFPHEVTPDHIKEELRDLLENQQLSNEARQAIFHGNAERLYHLAAPEPAVNGRQAVAAGKPGTRGS